MRLNSENVGQGHDLLKYGLEGNGTDRFDEEGYIALPICLWGPPPLEPPPLISGKKLWVRALFRKLVVDSILLDWEAATCF